MKNIVFDLGGVVFGRDPRKWEPEFMEFFAFIHAEKMPEFWVDYDRGTLTLDEVVRILSREKACDERVVKPEPEIYRRLLDRYSLDPAETLFIDDRPVNLEAARTFGISTFLFRHREAQRSCDELRKMLL